MSAGNGVRGFPDRPGRYPAVRTAPGADSRLNGIYTPRPYVYRGTGEDTLTAFLDDELPDAPRLTRRGERMEMLASMRLHDSDDSVAPAGYVTARQAAERLGVSTRTIERYKRDLRRTA